MVLLGWCRGKGGGGAWTYLLGHLGNQEQGGNHQAGSPEGEQHHRHQRQDPIASSQLSNLYSKTSEPGGTYGQRRRRHGRASARGPGHTLPTRQRRRDAGARRLA